MGKWRDDDGRLEDELVRKFHTLHEVLGAECSDADLGFSSVVYALDTHTEALSSILEIFILQQRLKKRLSTEAGAGDAPRLYRQARHMLMSSLARVKRTLERAEYACRSRREPAVAAPARSRPNERYHPYGGSATVADSGRLADMIAARRRRMTGREATSPNSSEQTMPVTDQDDDERHSLISTITVRLPRHRASGHAHPTAEETASSSTHGERERSRPPLASGSARPSRFEVMSLSSIGEASSLFASNPTAVSLRGQPGGMDRGDTAASRSAASSRPRPSATSSHEESDGDLPRPRLRRTWLSPPIESATHADATDTSPAPSSATAATSSAAAGSTSTTVSGTTNRPSRREHAHSVSVQRGPLPRARLPYARPLIPLPRPSAAVMMRSIPSVADFLNELGSDELDNTNPASDAGDDSDRNHSPSQ